MTAFLKDIIQKIENSEKIINESGYKSVSLQKRILAFFIDLCLIYSIMIIFIGIIFKNDTNIILTIRNDLINNIEIEKELLGSVKILNNIVNITPILYSLLSLLKFKATLGQKLLGITTISLSHGNLNINDILNRTILFVLSLRLCGYNQVFLVLFFLIPLFFTKNKAVFHDIVSNTKLIDKKK